MAKHTLLPASATLAHNRSLTFSDWRALQSADLLLWYGVAVEPALQAAVATLGADFAEHAWLGTGNGAEGAHHHVHDDELHPWLDPNAALLGLDDFTRALIVAVPEAEHRILARSRGLRTELELLEARTHQQLSVQTAVSVITDHPGLEVFLRHYRVPYVGSLRKGDHQGLSLQGLAKLRERASAQDHVCVLHTQGMAKPTFMAALKGGSVTTREIDLIGHRAQTYPEFLSQLASTLLNCAPLTRP